MTDLHHIPVKDFFFCNIKLKATCRSCGRERIIEGGLLPREFPPSTSIHPHQLQQFAKRLKCGGCGAYWPKTELVVDGGPAPSLP